MDSYNFTFKDVLKRRERMINRVEKWEVHALAIIMLVVTAFFTLSTFCFAVEESVDYTLTDYGLRSSANYNYFFQDNNFRQGYVLLEKGYIYTFTCNSLSGGQFVFCNEVPGLNVPYYNYTAIDGESSYSFIVDDNSEYFVFSCNNPNQPDGNRLLTRRPIDNYQDVVGGLVDNVGINQIWDVFGSGIDFVYVVIIVAFGIFLIAIAIKKISKGKSEI